MFNSVNALEFLKPKLSKMDKYNSTTTTKLLSSSLTQTRPFATITGYQEGRAMDSLQEKQSQFLLNNEVKHQERVKVQHLESPTKLQNNKCWNNYRTLYKSASEDVSSREMFQISQTKDDNEIDVVNVEHLSSTTIAPLNILTKSAFNLDLNNKYHNINSIGGNNCLEIDSAKTVETNNNYKFYCKQYNNYGLINKQSPTTSTIVMSTEPQPTATSTISQRTEDQNNAYRHIESVHNYAKSKSYEGDGDDNTSPNGSRHSSYLDDDEDDDEEDNDDDAEYDNDDDIDYENRLESNVDEIPDDLDEDYEVIFSKRRFRSFEKLAPSSDGEFSTKTNKTISTRAVIELQEPDHFRNILKDHKIQYKKVNKNKIRDSNANDEVQNDINIETMASPSPLSVPVLHMNSLMGANGTGEEAAASVKPDHHARRPMNAFLIFCKRHRAIVKERYKNLENRAITKILGDWWASLDTNDKKCFTSLAQQNKDAFFSANPNFKWYKLPAPPLRTLTTRPVNAFGQEYQDDNEANVLEMMSNNVRYNNNHSNYFKLADEAQMGDLSQLIQDKTKTTNKSVDLQQALGETSQFISAHITCDSEALEENHLKRRFYSENSFSSNSSEDEVVEPKKKSARSCKGKRYQELINSGQIVTALKKSKSSVRPMVVDESEINLKQNFSNVSNFSNNGCQKPESETMISYGLNGFDLEERIKELPALNLDDYLQRKRNTKKKKKCSSNGKKRGQRSNNSNNKFNDTKVKISVLSNERLQQKHLQMLKHQQQAETAVGSQKRKARKESITRRDVSAIEQEVASLLPLTINGCRYFQDAPTGTKHIETNEKDTEATSQSVNIIPKPPIIPSKENSSSSVSSEILNNTNTDNIILNDHISSSTSDLLILAEVAANRTEEND